MESSRQIFNFYSRYRWTDTDFALLQTETYDEINGSMENLAGPAVLSGHDCASVVGFVITVNAGVSFDAYGKPLKTTTTNQVTATAPAASRKCLVVARATSVNSDFIVKPTDPFTTVPLKSTRSTSIVLIQGTNGGGYPAKVAGDVVLFGVVFTSVGLNYIDYSQTERAGKNSALATKTYDKIVGRSSNRCTHAFLADAAAALSAGDRVLVIDDETIDAAVSITVPNVMIEFKPGVTLTKGTAATGIGVAASGVSLIRPRFKDFSGGTDYPAVFTSAGNACQVFGARFKTCTTNNVVDTATTDGVSIIGSIVEA